MYLLDRIAQVADSDPDRPYIEEIGDRSLTYGQMKESIAAASAQLGALGLRSGDRIVNMTHVSIENVLLWFAIANLGAIEFAVNPDLRGSFLADQLADVDPDAVLCDDADVDGVRDAIGSSAQVVGVRRGRPADRLALVASTGDEIEPPAEVGEQLRTVAPWDVASVMFTSGTTGRSKGVVVPWHQLHEVSRNSIPMDDLTERDAFYAPFALHHVTGKSACYTAVHLGGRVVLRPRFSVSEYWNDVARHGCTTTVMMGSMAVMLAGAPLPAETPLRNVLVAPLVDGAFRMAERLDLHICTVFNMTEVSSPITSGGWIGDRRDGCGWVRDGFECRVVDEHDCEVDDGTPGELVVRPDKPWTMFTEYWRNDAATKAAFRNLWFHTGDLFVREPDGYFVFKDRLKDSIRRRGENISSMELEAAILAQEGVEEVAAYGVPSELGEEDVMVALVVGDTFADVGTLHAALIERLPRFMVPRFYRIVDELPKTATEKVRKTLLRDEGSTMSAFDADPARTSAADAPEQR